MSFLPAGGKVAGSSIRYEFLEVIMEAGMGHSQRLEDMLFGEFSQAYSAYPLDQDR